MMPFRECTKCGNEQLSGSKCRACGGSMHPTDDTPWYAYFKTLWLSQVHRCLAFSKLHIDWFDIHGRKDIADFHKTVAEVLITHG